MISQQDGSWVTEFGLAPRRPPVFFRCIGDLDSMPTPAPQAHAMRRAFIELELDGILCLANAPTVYFKEVVRVDPGMLRAFQRRAWNQGLAPVLVVVDADNVHIYSSLALPARADANVKEGGRWVDTLHRATQAFEIRQALLGVETGEFFRIHAGSFDPNRRVDRRLLDNLGATRRALRETTSPRTDPRSIDALLCRIVFTCYLVDRRIIDGAYFAKIGAPNATRLLDVLEGRPAAMARALLYALFRQLQHDFNGDLFDIDPDAETATITDGHIEVLRRFLRGEDVAKGQMSLGFWAYDFSVIPIEMISAIYETFLSDDDGAVQATGAYYTPRFLAEVVLDTALDGLTSPLDCCYLDPACGSGIFLVGLFYRIAEEWRRRNREASYEKHVDALLGIIQNQIFGIDNNLTACRIAAFSLYIALLDQLAPPAIHRLQARGRWLPRLVSEAPKAGSSPGENRTILCSDFATVDPTFHKEGFDLIVGNPPWVSRSRQRRRTTPDASPSLLLEWCNARNLPVAQGQIAQAFIWKAPQHLRPGGRICFLLPYGVLFNHDTKALEIQRLWFEQFPPDRIVNLSDLRFLLFKEAIKPALIVRYMGTTPADKIPKGIEYFVPKADLGILQAELLAIAPEDRTELSRDAVLKALRGHQIPPWKERLWGTPRDWKLIERLAALPRLGAIVDQARDRLKKPDSLWKRWIAGQGFQPIGPSDSDIDEPQPAWGRDTRFIKADSSRIDLLLQENDCPPIAHQFGPLRRRPRFEEIFHKPHVIVTKGMRVAYADFDVVFQHAAQGIHGPPADSSLLMFLAAYLRSPLAHYYLFHTVANWGAERPEVHLEELLQVPFPLPDDTLSPKSAHAIVHRVAARMRRALANLPLEFGRDEAIKRLNVELWDDIAEYFGVGPSERILIDDTLGVAMHSATPRPTKAHEIPTLRLSSDRVRRTYLALLCETLNSWTAQGAIRIDGYTLVSEKAGLGVAVLQQALAGTATCEDSFTETFLTRDRGTVLERAMSQFAARRGAVLLARSIKVFVQNELFILKPLQGRFWTRTAALNDADEIIAAILGSSPTPDVPSSPSRAQRNRKARL